MKSLLSEKLITILAGIGLGVIALPYIYHLLTLLIERTFSNLPQ